VRVLTVKMVYVDVPPRKPVRDARVELAREVEEVLASTVRLISFPRFAFPFPSFVSIPRQIPFRRLRSAPSRRKRRKAETSKTKGQGLVRTECKRDNKLQSTLQIHDH
jgi:hypothetical protein